MQAIVAAQSFRTTVKNVFSKHTTLASAVSGFAVFGFGDVVSQCLDKPAGTRVNWERVVKMGAFGAALNGVCYLSWYRALDRAFGTKRSSMSTVMKKTIADQVIMAPFALTACLAWAPLKESMDSSSAQKAYDNVESNVLEAWVMDCKVWPLANMVAFSLVPTIYRPTFIACVQLGWQSYMSWISHRGLLPQLEWIGPTLTAEALCESETEESSISMRSSK